MEEQGAKLNLYLNELHGLSLVFQEETVSLIVLENGGLAFGVHPVSTNYSFGDFDLLLAISDLRRAHEILVQRGYRCLTAFDADNSTGFNMSSGRVQYKRDIATGLSLSLNIQTTFVARRWLFSGNEPDFAMLLQRSLGPHPGGVRILGREDFLLQLCVHNAAHSYLRNPGIRLHLDVDWYLRCVGEEVNWDNFIVMATALKLKTVVYLSLLIPQVILGSPVPQVVLTALAPGRVKGVVLAKILSKGDLLAPQKRQFHKSSFILFNLLLHDDLASLAKSVIPTREHLLSCCGLTPGGSRAKFLFKHYLRGGHTR
ncbi:hypothetical protein GMLC_28020 [Geomonas limicola]|uniref:Nucleotidyltransferase family protein n=2 Tax=Geomonas limicola TaxID=2740186 RepID=A0A6V8NCF1_9BACT|nr:hypothetical protein GMLC_28020 [Geomonas limicola]